MRRPRWTTTQRRTLSMTRRPTPSKSLEGKAHTAASSSQTSAQPGKFLLYTQRIDDSKYQSSLQFVGPPRK
jgi:hypothetical protein